MRSWRALEEVRSDHARNALRAIAAGEKLSSDVSDIVERMLKG
jgi:aminopeptidase N